MSSDNEKKKGDLLDAISDREHDDIPPPDAQIWQNARSDLEQIWKELDKYAPKRIESKSFDIYNNKQPEKYKFKQNVQLESKQSQGWQRQSDNKGRIADSGKMEVLPPEEDSKDSTTTKFINELLTTLKPEPKSTETQRTNFDTAHETFNREVIKPNQKVQGDPLSPYIDPEARKRKTQASQIETQEGKGLAIIIVLALLGILIVVLLWKFYTH